MEEVNPKEVETVAEKTPLATESQSESANNTDNSQKASKRTIRRTLKALALVVIFSALGAALIEGVVFLIRRHHVLWERPLTSDVEVIRYGNDDYQLRRTDNHKRISKRYKIFDNQHLPQDSVVLLGKKGYYVLFSLMRGCPYGNELSRYTNVYQPDSEGRVAVVDEHYMLKFLDIHDCGNPIPGTYPIDKDKIYMYEICFEGEYCVFPHRDKGVCLINRAGHILMEGREDISLIDSNYVLVTDVNGTETLYDAHSLRPLLSGKKAIHTSPAGVYFYEGRHCYLMDSTATNMLTDLVLDICEYRDLLGVATLYEPDEDFPSPYKAFSTGGYTGVFDREYHVIIEPKWDDIQYLGDGYFSCEFDDHVIIMDKQGEMVRR